MGRNAPKHGQSNRTKRERVAPQTRERTASLLARRASFVSHIQQGTGSAQARLPLTDDGGNVPRELQRLANTMLDVAARAVLEPSSIKPKVPREPRPSPVPREDDQVRALAAAALKNRTEYYMSDLLLYPDGAKLPLHVDKFGSWVSAVRKRRT